MEPNVFTRTLYFRDPEINSDKVYVATLDGLTVTLEWGRRGATLQKKRQTFLHSPAASHFWHAKIGEKIAKGYRDLSQQDSPWATFPAPVKVGDTITVKKPAFLTTPAPKPPVSAPAIPAHRPLQAGGRKFRFDD